MGHKEKVAPGTVSVKGKAALHGKREARLTSKPDSAPVPPVSPAPRPSPWMMVKPRVHLNRKMGTSGRKGCDGHPLFLSWVWVGLSKGSCHLEPGSWEEGRWTLTSCAESFTLQTVSCRPTKPRLRWPQGRKSSWAPGPGEYRHCDCGGMASPGQAWL